jgi:hypothetical protein
MWCTAYISFVLILVVCKAIYLLDNLLALLTIMRILKCLCKAVISAPIVCKQAAGGKYTEDCGVSEPVREDDGTLGLNDPGYKPHAYDAEGAKKLWELSAKMTGVEE